MSCSPAAGPLPGATASMTGRNVGPHENPLQMRLLNLGSKIKAEMDQGSANRVVKDSSE